MWPDALEICLRCQFPRFSRISGWRCARPLSEAPHMEPRPRLAGTATRFERHRPEATLFYQLVERHFPEFLLER